jgi:RNA polymerase sigma factor (sigma-70 family)
MESLVDRDTLWSEFSPLVQKLIHRYGVDPELRADLPGEIYFRFNALFDAYDPGRGVPLRTYLIRHLSASIFTYSRRKWRDPARTGDWELFERYGQFAGPSDPITDLGDRIMFDEICSLLPNALEELTTQQREVVTGRFFDGLSYDVIAERLGIQSSTARSLLRDSLNHLRHSYGDQGISDQAMLNDGPEQSVISKKLPQRYLTSAPSEFLISSSIWVPK